MYTRLYHTLKRLNPRAFQQKGTIYIKNKDLKIPVHLFHDQEQAEIACPFEYKEFLHHLIISKLEKIEPPYQEEVIQLSITA